MINTKFKNRYPLVDINLMPYNVYLQVFIMKTTPPKEKPKIQAAVMIQAN